ncbi:MAG TPA: hypothetical protein QF753_08385 [Victivallales bacterium]|nr:hypothetical protein [Victivallales bacterium]
MAADDKYIPMMEAANKYDEIAYPTLTRWVRDLTEEERELYIKEIRNTAGRTEKAILTSYLENRLKSKVNAKNEHEYNEKKEENSKTRKANEYATKIERAKINELAKINIEKASDIAKYESRAHTLTIKVLIIVLFVCVLMFVSGFWFFYKETKINHSKELFSQEKLFKERIKSIEREREYENQNYTDKIARLQSDSGKDKALLEMQYKEKISTLKNKVYKLEIKQSYLEHQIYVDSGRVSKTEKAMAPKNGSNIFNI